MTPFLKLVADDLYRKLEGNFQNTTIVFPNKRASLFFNQYLWENAEGKTIWTPEYTTISEVFATLADVTVADPIFLAVKLFDVYRRRMLPTKTLDQLYPMMETMLSDFQDIDNNMVEPRKLFLNIADWKELTDFSFLDDEQREAIEQFFGRFFDGANPNTPLKTQFKTLWNQLADIYDDFRDELLHPADGEPMVYEGMLKRHVVETLKRDDEASRSMDKRLRAQTYVMIGFNVLNKTELELFQYIKKNRDAKFYWDYDNSYTKRDTSSKLLSKYEAGQFILSNISILGDEFEGTNLFDNMHSHKNITFIQSPTENAQTRYIDTWMKEHLNDDTPLQQSAVILCNENLLQPTLHSIGEVAALNVTMGYPLANTPVYSLIQALIELQIHGKNRSDAWRFKPVSAVLKHPFIQKILGRDSYLKLKELTKGNVIYPSQEYFSDNETLRSIFMPVSGKRLTVYLSEILSLIGHYYQDSIDNKNFTLQIYKESIYVAYTVVNRIHLLQEGSTALSVNDETLARLIMQLMHQATIPFHGEPAVGLQVMGLLETRNLDFSNVIMLSVNEGQMPKSDKRPSLIPYTLRAAFGMTTIEKEVSLYAYYYYRLLQRAEHITLLYNSSTEGGSKGEMSRFMLQTLAESKSLFAEGQTIDLRSFSSASQTQGARSFPVKKDAQVMERLHSRFDAEHILSPSAINTYMKCPLKFYFNYVAGLRPDQDVSENIDKPMFGTIFHYAMEKTLQPYVGSPISSATLEKIAKDDALLIQQLNNSFAVNFFKKAPKDELGNIINYTTDSLNKITLNGTLLINRHVIKKFMIHQLTADADMARHLEMEDGYLQIISQEEKYTTLINIQGTKLLLGGFVDRLDLLHLPKKDRIRIVDYKTSNSAQKAGSVEDLFDSEKCAENYHIMQTLYYCKVLTSPSSPYSETPVVPALMYCATDYGKNYSGIVKMGNPDVLNSKGKPTPVEIEDYKKQYSETYELLLEEKIAELFTPFSEEAPAETSFFQQCANDDHCKYCDFLTFCQRHPESYNSKK